jgi:RIO-like serine/threonine protein kinase
MPTFKAPKKKRVDDEVFEVYRNGIVHGTVVNFNNVVVATKAWNMLFAVADWDSATTKAAAPAEPQPDGAMP